MGTGNAAVKQWLSNRNRFADLFNGFVFGGEQIVFPEELEPTETETDILVKDKNEKIKEVQRHRDIVMKWKKGIELVILACENQQKIHYAMPVRNMLYDSLTYTEQIRRLHEFQKTELGMPMTNDEFLSKFRKDDKICPVITVVLYYGEKLWNGSEDLYGMLTIEKMLRENKVLQRYIPNYRINLLEPGRMESLECFRTDLQEILSMLKYRSNRKELMEYVKENEQYFRSVDEETYYVLREFLHSKKMLKDIRGITGREEKVDMCKAWEELYNDGVEAGMEAGIEVGIEKAALNIAKRLLGTLDVQTIAEKVGLPIEMILSLQDENTF